jgi:hypothetical protein
MAENTRASQFEHPHIFGSFRNWVRLLWDNRGIDLHYAPRALTVSLMTFATIPLKLYERIRYGAAVENARVHPSPIFIIGHWRTGTTHLHHLLCQDRRFGYISMFEVTAPGFCLVGQKTIKKPLSLVQKKRHPTRDIDNIPLTVDNPEEEDVAIACMSPYSYLHGYTFPRRAQYYFETYVTRFCELPASVIAKWTETYLTILRKATLRTGGKRLVIKNCANSTRIGTLLDIFPDAKFIHIRRNPYSVYRSTLWLHRIVFPRAQLHEIGPAEVEAHLLRSYPQLMQRLLADRELIPDGNLVEVKYEDLEEAPLDQLRRIYETLGLPGYAEAEPAFQAYLHSIAGYKKNPYKIDDGVVAKVNRHWDFAFEALGYDRIEPGSGG